MKEVLADTSMLEEITSKSLMQWGPVVFTNHMFVITVATAALLIILPLTFRNTAIKVPRGFRNALEAICLYLREEVVRPFLGDRTDKYIGIIWTLFFFILTMNLIGLMPVDRVIFLITGAKHWGGAPTANLWITGALAVVSFITFHAAGMVENGVVQYIRTFSPKVPWPMMPFIFVMELISSFVRMISLAIRLFANILAGHILLTVLLLFIVMFQNPFVATASTLVQVLMGIMELFVAFLQAYIFTFLTTIFIGMAVHPEH